MDGKLEFDSSKDLVKSDPKWGNYIKGIVQQFKTRGWPVSGFNAAIASTIPLGGGVSSSAALEVATVTLLAELASPKIVIDPVERAKIGKASSNTFIGVPCGIMDQLISSTGKANFAMLIDCRSLSLEPIPLSDPSVRIVISNTNVKHELEGSEYSVRKDHCFLAVDAIKKMFPKETKITHLRDCTMEQLEAARGTMKPETYKRAKHVIGEDIRTMNAVKAFKAGDYKTVGENIYGSHASLRDDYEVSCEELDHLVEIARTVPGVYGSRMMGGGFGGCTVTLVKAEAVDALIKKIDEEYPKKTGGKYKASSFVSLAGEGAGVLSLGDYSAHTSRRASKSFSGSESPLKPLESLGERSHLLPTIAAAAAGMAVGIIATFLFLRSTKDK
jgi:galactokinase